MQCIVVHGVVQPLRCCSGLKASNELSGLCFWSLKLTMGGVMNYLAIYFDFGSALENLLLTFSELSGLCFWSLNLTVGGVMNYLAID